MKSDAKIKASLDNRKGITLIALIITIIILLILAGVSLSLLMGENGIIDRSVEASFKTNFRAVEEQVTLYSSDKIAEAYLQDKVLVNSDMLPISTKLSEDDINDLKNSLKSEILELTGVEDVTQVNLYHLDSNKISMPHEYIIDIDSTQIYDVPGSRYYKKWHHTLDSKGFDNIVTTPVTPTIVDDSPITRVGDIGWYAPNMSGFSKKYTYLIYYNADCSSKKEIPVQEYLDGGKQNVITDNGTTYYLDKYDDKMWANAKTTGNNLDCEWVWLPRYAYKLNSTDKQAEIIFVDINDNPIGKVSAYDTINGTTTTDFATEYTVHPTFNVDGKKLKGIWIAKYEANNNKTHEMDSGLCYEPDMTGFDPRYTYIELYDATTGTFTDQLLSSANLNTINNDGAWYDYSKKQWANIKTNANNLECWWVWLPRYAYHLSEGNKEAEIIFIDKNNKPIDKEQYGNSLPEQFTVHPAFDVDGKKLKGIWVAKYEVNNNKTHEMASGLCYAPDTTGFDANNTYIELYNATTDTFTEQLLSSANLNTINNDGAWYDYSKKQWANIKTNANGLEAWWVWLPRYAYHLSEGNKEAEIIFIDTNNKPIDTALYGDTLPSQFTVHPAFDVDGDKLQGIWVAKYEANTD